MKPLTKDEMKQIVGGYETVCPYVPDQLIRVFADRAKTAPQKTT
ncbi:MULTISPECIES: bacteriocin [unclassified Hydrotalea]|nr:bacteriocin [Hydrotalea sp. AMD]RWZ86173.1 MAG: bacteriocin [Hydrotalea sp. AMD]